nr:MAG TPA: hypothetical protein [Caudoviricetes sp.]
MNLPALLLIIWNLQSDSIQSNISNVNLNFFRFYIFGYTSEILT